MQPTRNPGGMPGRPDRKRIPVAFSRPSPHTLDVFQADWSGIIEMTRPGLFGSPFFLGFDEMERVLERLSRVTPDAYPPLNIEEPDANTLRITLAVAGFAPDQLSVSLCDRELSVRGEKPQSAEGRVFLHKGIAARGFSRTFVLAHGIEIAAATLSNGLLRIDLTRSPKAQAVVHVPITPL